MKILTSGDRRRRAGVHRVRAQICPADTRAGRNSFGFSLVSTVFRIVVHVVPLESNENTH